VSGNSIVVKEEHPLKAELPICIASGKLAVIKAEHP
jgi:hypothetical protein